jgi:hypothetical protein
MYKGEETIMGFPRKKCPTCSRTISYFWNEDSCEICSKYGYPNKGRKLPIPCKTCGEDFKVKHIISPNGTFKISHLINCITCRDKIFENKMKKKGYVWNEQHYEWKCNNCQKSSFTEHLTTCKEYKQ